MKYFFQQQFILEQNISIRYFLDIHNYIHIYMKTVENSDETYKQTKLLSVIITSSNSL